MLPNVVLLQLLFLNVVLLQLLFPNVVLLKLTLLFQLKFIQYEICNGMNSGKLLSW